MNNLETLRPEVRDAINRQDRQEKCDEYCPACEDRATIRTELLRLTRENAELRRAWGDTLLTGTGILKVERIDPAAVMLPLEPRPRNETPVPKSEWEALTERAEKAEAELAESRETIKRLNRRVQVAEAGVAEKVKASGGSLGRALANAAADRYMRERDEAQAKLAALKARIAEAPIIHAEKTWRGTLFMNLSQHDVDLLDGKRVRLLVEDDDEH